jgi:hypothetical protein
MTYRSVGVDTFHACLLADWAMLDKRNADKESIRHELQNVKEI